MKLTDEALLTAIGLPSLESHNQEWILSFSRPSACSGGPIELAADEKKEKLRREKARRTLTPKLRARAADSMFLLNRLHSLSLIVGCYSQPLVVVSRGSGTEGAQGERQGAYRLLKVSGN